MMVVLLFACGMSEDRFENVGLRRWCLQSNACDSDVDPDACMETLRSQDRAGCSFDPVAAQACHDALRSGVCIDVGLEVRVLDVPESCEETWVCGGER